MKRSKKIFKLEEKSNGDVFWNVVFLQLLGENRINDKIEDYDITPNIQKYSLDTKFTTKTLTNNEKETVVDILNNVGFYDTKYIRGLNSSRIKGALCNLPKAIAKILNPLLPESEIIEDSYEEISDLKNRRCEKNIIPFNIFEISARLEILLGLKLSGHTDTLTEASNLIDELYKRSEIQNEQQNRIALNIIHTSFNWSFQVKC